MNPQCKRQKTRFYIDLIYLFSSDKNTKKNINSQAEFWMIDGVDGGRPQLELDILHEVVYS